MAARLCVARHPLKRLPVRWTSQVNAAIPSATSAAVAGRASSGPMHRCTKAASAFRSLTETRAFPDDGPDGQHRLVERQFSVEPFAGQRAVDRRAQREDVRGPGLRFALEQVGIRELD